MGAIATFPLFVPPFLLPLYVTSVGLSGQTAAAILASWNLASAVGRIGMGFGADAYIGPVNSMLASLTIIAVSTMALWPFASSLGLLVFFAILNGMGSGGFFSLMPVVVGAVFGDSQLATIMSMLITSWTFGYFMVCGKNSAGLLFIWGMTDYCTGSANCRLSVGSLWWCGGWTFGFSPCLLLCWLTDTCERRYDFDCPFDDEPKGLRKSITRINASRHIYEYNCCVIAS
jgi:MFS family permease